MSFKGVTRVLSYDEYKELREACGKSGSLEVRGFRLGYIMNALANYFNQEIRKKCLYCNSADNYGCPHCGHNCEMTAKTIHSDEDGHCDKCNKDCLMADDGLSMVALEKDS